MNCETLKKVLNNSDIGFALHKVEKDSTGRIIDYKFIFVNDNFEKFTGLKASDLINKRVTEIIPNITRETFPWIDFYGEITSKNINKKIRQYAETLGRWYEIEAYSPFAEHFVTIFNEIKFDYDEFKTYQEIFDVSLDIMAVISLDGNIIKANQAFSDISKYDLKHIEGLPIYSFIHPREANKIKELISAILSDKSIKAYQSRIICSDGSIKNIQWKFTVKEEVIFVSGYDITEQLRKELEQEFKAAKFKSLFDENPLPMIVVNGNNNTISMMNKAFFKLCSNITNEIYGKNILSLDFWESSSSNSTIYKLLFNPASYNENMIQRIKCDYEVKEFILSREYLKLEDKDLTLITFMDVTEVNKKNNQLEYLLNLQSTIGEISNKLIIANKDEKKALIEKLFSEIGLYFRGDKMYTVEKDITGEFISYNFDWISKHCKHLENQTFKFNKTLYDALVELHKNKQILVYYDFDKQAPSTIKLISENRQLKSFCSISIIDKGEIKGFINLEYLSNYNIFTFEQLKLLEYLANLYSNIYEKSHSESRLKKLNLELAHQTEKALCNEKAAKKANKAKSEFLATMSHELRTPLNGVIGFTELLYESKLSENQKNYLDLAIKSAHSLLEIINDILDFTKLETRTFEIQTNKTNVRQMIDEVIDLIRLSVSAKGLSLNIFIKNNVPKYIFIDSVRIKQVLNNLISNAIKFTDLGEIDFIVEFSENLKVNGKGTISFKVIDTGIGISEEEFKRIFKAFEQADTTLTRKFGGTGLGLIISNNIVSQMSGKISLKSEVNKGSEFTVELPVKYSEKQIFNANTNYTKEIYVVSTNLKTSNYIKELLKNTTYKLHLYNNPNHLLTAINNNNKIDLVIFDCLLYQANGFEVVSKIKTNEGYLKHNFPIIVMYELQHQEYIEEHCKKLNINLKLLKPIKSSDFLYLIEKADKRVKKINTKDKDKMNQTSIISNKNHKILIVEDNKLNLKLVKKMLEKLLPFSQLDSAENGLIGYKKATSERYDLILMDLQMPEMNGFTSAKLINEQLGNTAPPIVPLTANATKEDRLKSKNSGMVGYITKPIILNALIDALTEFLL